MILPVPDTYNTSSTVVCPDTHMKVARSNGLLAGTHLEEKFSFGYHIFDQGHQTLDADAKGQLSFYWELGYNMSL